MRFIEIAMTAECAGSRPIRAWVLSKHCMRYRNRYRITLLRVGWGCGLVGRLGDADYMLLAHQKHRHSGRCEITLLLQWSDQLGILFCDCGNQLCFIDLQRIKSIIYHQLFFVTHFWGRQWRRKQFASGGGHNAEIFLMCPPPLFSCAPPHEGAQRLFVTDWETIEVSK